MTERHVDRPDAGAVRSTLRLQAERSPLALQLLGPGVELEVALHGRVTLRIGRSRDNDIVVDHPSVSRQHARLHTFDGFALEALAATNPVRFGGRQLSPGDRVAIAPGEPFALGSLVGVIQPARRPSSPSLPQLPLIPPGATVVDPAMLRLYEVVARIARSDVPVLIEGETGSGKEVVAHALHLGSARASGPFVRINCGALPSTLVESELFGHERGAFTGADRDKIGLLASASGGTVFLDEIGEMPLVLQTTLLRVLEEGAARRVGATRSTPIDVRWVAATNRDLASEAERGRFRKDLYYRLQGFVVAVPPLRERRAEIRAIAAALAQRGPMGPRMLTDELLGVLERYHWPGNVRELRNVLGSAALLADAGPIDVGHLPGALRGPAATAVVSSPSSRVLRDVLAEEERRQIIEALQRSSGNQSRAAELLGMPRRTLVKRLRAYGIPRGRVIPGSDS